MGLVPPLVPRLSAPHVTSVASVHTFRRLPVLLDAPVVGSGDAGELLPPPGSGGRSWPPFLQKFSIVATKSCLLPFHRLTTSRLWQWVA
jgi:hypothetical protein